MNDAKTMPGLIRQLTLDSKPEVIHVVENTVDELKNELEFKEDVYANVMIAVTEAVNNSIIHGNKNDTSKQVFINFETKTPYMLVVKVRDEGPGFDPSKLPDPTAPENIENIGGRGVFLMRHLSDSLNFSEDGKEVEMIFNI